MKKHWGRMARHLIGYGLITLMVIRETMDWATIAMAGIVVVVFDLHGVTWLKTKLFDLAKQWVGKGKG